MNKLEDKYEEHLRKEQFEGITFKQLYDDLDKKENEKYYNGYRVERNLDFIKLKKKDNNTSFYFTNKKKKIYKVEIIGNGEKEEEKDIISTYEIINFVQKYLESVIYFKGETFQKNKNYMFFADSSNNIKFYYTFNKLKEFEGNRKNIEHSETIKKFLKNDNFQGKEYFESEQRSYLHNILFEFEDDCQGFNLIKFTGLSGIGKTFFLYNFASLVKEERIYINLKILNNIYESFGPIEMKNYLITELNNIEPIENNNITKINEIFKNQFEKLSSFLKELIICFMQINLKAIIILDQFKYKYISYDDLNQIEKQLIGKKDSQFKMIICSNINDDFVRSSLIELWDRIKKEHKQILFDQKDIQRLFHYFPRLIDNKL